MCEHADVPIFIAQHMPEKFTASMTKSLDSKCRHTMKEAENLELVQPECVYIGPGGKHMLLRHLDQGTRLVITKGPPEEGCRPSVNILFRSASTVYGGDTIAIVLIGMGTDGTKGVEALKRAGASVIAQDEATSTVWGMPRCLVTGACKRGYRGIQ
ncbi:MAG: hypothetical protein B6245_20340 [Desulfobacteraceae bacterium 4572_88]|nr:MAG: hypothetical protein B6245_20340 [Desulfobacteraceae bacterium 4572_88]